MKVSTWHNCYDGSWNGLIVPEAFSHPAKFAPGLIKRIFEHCLERGYIRKGDTVVDPFGGIGAGGIFAAPMGLKWIGNELEPKFVDLARDNFALHAHAWEVMDYPQPVIIQGDSRRLSQVLREADLIATSPPFMDCHSVVPVEAHARQVTSERVKSKIKYGGTNGQNGNLKAVSINAVCTSPPYAESLNTEKDGIDWEKTHHGSRDKAHGKHGQCNYAIGRHNYSPNPANIGNLKAGEVGAVVTSPPWEKSLDNIIPRSEDGFDNGAVATFNRTGKWPERRPLGMDYGKSEGQIGQESSENYWIACAQVYAECHKVLKPREVIVIVVKSYIKAGRRVPLPMQTLKLLIHLGFEPLERIKASLVKETVTAGLFGDVRKIKERKSFFRRLAEKNGSPAIDWEEVLICRKP